MTKTICLIFCLFFFVPCTWAQKAFQSFETDYTISKVRSAKNENESYIVGSSYEGTIVATSYHGQTLWTNPLSGFMNHDIWCGDIDKDGKDEIFAANADGNLYCLNSDGTLLWHFKKNSAPMYSVCTINDGKNTYAVCSSYDKSIYYVNSKGKEIKELSSYTYSQENPVQPYPKAIPDSTCHLANFVRPIKNADGSETLVVHGVVHSMAIWARGSVYLFKPLENQPYKIIDLADGRPLGELRWGDTDEDGNDELLMGTSTMIHQALMLKVDVKSEQQNTFAMKQWPDRIDNFGYRVVQPELISDKGEKKYFILYGARILLAPLSLNANETLVLANRYSFNDMWNDNENARIILASIQSGGSCVHIIDTKNSNWKNEYENFIPKGKIEKILSNTEILRHNLQYFKAPEWEKEPRDVFLMSESVPKTVEPLVNNIKKNYPSPIFLDGAGIRGAEKYDRSYIKNERYRNRRDTRRTYHLTSQEVVDHFSSKYKEEGPGIAFWGGHGNDPYMFQRKTLEGILDNANGKKTVLIFPELEDHSENFEYVLNDYVYPLAEHCRLTNAMFYVRTKHNFWFSTIHLPMWSRLMSGELSDVFIPAMEETTDKSMELSVAARLGVWASGAVDSWGSRCARDNPSFDRLRQHSHQMLPNHFLRNMIFHVSYGAQYLDNFTVDQEYMSLLWELIAKGALYVPERSEIVSFSPVHMSIINPDEHFINRSSNVKWTTFYDEEFEENNHFVFSRLSGSWPGAPVTEWDFSKYAGGVNDRHLNFLAPYNNGMVLLTPPQNGVNAQNQMPRGKLTNHLNPIYKNIMKEFYTDGRDYFSADGKEKHGAESYYKTVQKELEENSMLIPITVSGDNVAWVVSQSSPKHLRLTLIDGGYINPNDRTATVTFNTVVPVKMHDILNKEEFEISGGKTTVQIPCGMFRFIDIELRTPLN